MDVMSLECQLSLHINKRGQRNKLLDGYNLSKTWESNHLLQNLLEGSF